MTRGPYKTKPAAGSFADLILAFYRSGTYRNWAPSTSKKNDRFLRALMRANGTLMVADLRRGDVIRMRDEFAETPEAGNSFLKLLKQLLAYAADLEMVEHNVAGDVKRLENQNPDGLRTWREDELARYLEWHEPGELPHRVFTLALYTGAARVDLVKLGWLNIKGDRLIYRRQKTRRKTQVTVDIPILPELEALLATIPPGWTTFLQTAYGQMRSPFSVTNDFKRWVEEAGLGGLDEYGCGLTVHGLRKALARRLAEAGCTPQTIMAALGHSSVTQAMDYSKAYDRARAADAMQAIDTAPKTNVTRIRRKE